jgi:colicin import membrane protein
MARKLKTYQTSLGFYDLAIAAPSMKAALEAWGAGSNLFHQGIANETDDPHVVAATMAKPGVVLRRPAGSSGQFAEHSDLPTDLDGEQPRSRNGKGRPKPKKEPPPKITEKAARKAALDFEREQKRRREAERRREQAARAKERERRDKAIAKAQGALEKAEREHAKKAAAIQAEAEALEERSRAEDARWDAERERLQTALRRARG